MKSILKELKLVKRKIKEDKIMIDMTKFSCLSKVYIAQCKKSLNREFTLLENLQIAIELKKADNQEKLRKL